MRALRRAEATAVLRALPHLERTLAEAREELDRSTQRYAATIGSGQWEVLRDEAVSPGSLGPVSGARLARTIRDEWTRLSLPEVDAASRATARDFERLAAAEAGLDRARVANRTARLEFTRAQRRYLDAANSAIQSLSRLIEVTVELARQGARSGREVLPRAGPPAPLTERRAE